jgi:hypothetical protein
MTVMPPPTRTLCHAILAFHHWGLEMGYLGLPGNELMLWGEFYFLVKKFNQSGKVGPKNIKT